MFVDFYLLTHNSSPVHFLSIYSISSTSSSRNHSAFFRLFLKQLERHTARRQEKNCPSPSKFHQPYVFYVYKYVRWAHILCSMRLKLTFEDYLPISRRLSRFYCVYIRVCALYEIKVIKKWFNETFHVIRIRKKIYIGSVYGWMVKLLHTTTTQIQKKKKKCFIHPSNSCALFLWLYVYNICRWKRNLSTYFTGL